MGNVKLNAAHENFFKAYYEAWYGNTTEIDWRLYLTVVYIKAKGNISQFNRERSLNKFKNVTNDTLKKARKYLQSIARGEVEPELTDLYRQFSDIRDTYLKKKGDRYIDIYVNPRYY